MALTENLYAGDGSTVLFSFTFEYLEESDVKVSLDAVDTTAYTFANATTIQFNTPPAVGVSIRIYRSTDITELKATFFPGSSVRAQDLNSNADQLLYAVQEVRDNTFLTDGSSTMVGDLDMGGFEVINMAAPSSDGSAVNKQYVDSRLGDVDIPGYTRWRYNAAGAETVLSGVGSDGNTLQYSALREHVYLNGALLQRGVDYTADNGTSITLLSGPLLAGDVVDVRCVNNLSTAPGKAEDVSFLQAGTGATLRTVDSKLKDVVSVKDFGAVGDGVTDDTAAIQAAVSASGEVHFPSGTYRLLSTLNLRNKVVFAEGATFKCDHAGIGVILGGNQASGENPVQKLRHVYRVSGDYSTTPSVRIIGAKNQQIWVKRSPYIQLYADTDIATDASCAYSSFWFNYVDKLELETNPSPSGSTTQWINENVFYLNRIQHLRVAGTYNHNNNKFLYGNFENGTIVFERGADNRVEGIRGEAGCAVTFASGASNNVVLATWQSSGQDFTFPGTVTDSGYGNHAGHQRWIDNKLVPITAFTYESLVRYPDSSFNVKGVTNVNVGSSDITVSAFAYFYNSGIIPCDGRALTIYAQLLGRISGGYRLIIDGYDASKTPIASTGADFSAPGSGTHGFGTESWQTPDGSTDQISAYLLNENTKYIRIRCRASSNGIAAEGFALGVRYNNSDKRDPLWAQAAAGSLTQGVPAVNTLTKTVALSDNVQANIFTFAIPSVSTSIANVSFGFEISYVIKCSRTSSTRSWRATYGKVYGAISRGWESNTNAAPLFSITTTDQSLVTTSGTAPTITWAESLDAGTDNAAKNGYLAVTVDNPISATNSTEITATINWVVNNYTDVGVS